MIPAHVGAHNPDGVRRHGRFDAFRPPARTPSAPAIPCTPRHGLACIAPASFAHTSAPGWPARIAAANLRPVDQRVADAGQRLRAVEGKAFEKLVGVLYEERSQW